LGRVEEEGAGWKPAVPATLSASFLVEPLLGRFAAGSAGFQPAFFWPSRGDVPHFDYPGLIQAATFRLAGSLPCRFVDPCDRCHLERSRI
jgi:hypothetical protein